MITAHKNHLSIPNPACSFYFVISPYQLTPLAEHRRFESSVHVVQPARSDKSPPIPVDSRIAATGAAGESHRIARDPVVTGASEPPAVHRPGGLVVLLTRRIIVGQLLPGPDPLFV